MKFIQNIGILANKYLQIIFGSNTNKAIICISSAI